MMTVEAACIHNSRRWTANKRKQSSAMFDNARLAARRVIRAASSLPDNDDEGSPKTSFYSRDDTNSERPTRFRALFEL